MERERERHWVGRGEGVGGCEGVGRCRKMWKDMGRGRKLCYANTQMCKEGSSCSFMG